MQYQTGEIKLERVLAIVLLVLLMAVFIYKILGFAAVSEKMVVEARIQQFQAALNIHFAELMMQGKQQQAAEMDASNPLVYFQKAFPKQTLEYYLGERWKVKFPQMETGSWVFDSHNGHLIYKLKYDDLINNSDPIPMRLQWRVKAQIIEENTLIGKAKRSRVEAVKLEAVYSYFWDN